MNDDFTTDNLTTENKSTFQQFIENALGDIAKASRTARREHSVNFDLDKTRVRFECSVTTDYYGNIELNKSKDNEGHKIIFELAPLVLDYGDMPF